MITTYGIENGFYVSLFPVSNRETNRPQTAIPSRFLRLWRENPSHNTGGRGCLQEAPLLTHHGLGHTWIICLAEYGGDHEVCAV